MLSTTDDLRISELKELSTPQEVMGEIPRTLTATRVTMAARNAIHAILTGTDDRLLVVVGPCSVHDPVAAVEYAERLVALREKLADRLEIVMRVYFEKPRTTVGWKGLINDPHLNDTFDIATGLRIARRMLLEVVSMKLPTATELLEPITPQYIADLISIAAIGARTTESPTHRQMSSGLSMPVGFKNGTDGSLQVAIDAMHAARHPHSFLGIDNDGKTCIVNTKGNPWGFLVVRGGRTGPNYDAASLAEAADLLKKSKLSPRLMVDCSHANSNKDYTKQHIAWHDCFRQRAEGNRNIIGLMLESNLLPGNQPLPQDPSQLKFGISITDGCIGWEETERLIRDAHAQLGGKPADA